MNRIIGIVGVIGLVLLLGLSVSRARLEGWSLVAPTPSAIIGRGA